MKANTPQGSVVFAWWDYGYWITALGDRRTLADNGTQNSTQIGIIAQTFLDNATFAVPNLKRYNVSYVAIFITPSGGQAGTGTTSYQGFGEDGKWYWMARIGNNTVWDYNHNYNIRFLMITNPQATQAQTAQTYIRVIQDAATGKQVSNATITDNNEPNQQTMLGWMMNKGTLQAGAATSPFDSYFKQVFRSTNGFVLLYQASFPSAVNLKMVNINTPITLGQKVLFSGNLTEANGNSIPISRGEQKVALEILEPSGQWATLQAVTVSPVGSFSGAWSPQNAGRYVVRAHYSGLEGVYFDAATPPQQLNVTGNTVNLTVSASQTTVTAGQPVGLTWTMSPFVKDANVTLAYSTENGTPKVIGVFPMSSPTMSYGWTVPISGRFTIMVSWAGNDRYGPASASLVMNRA
jgi:hypothetical protein